MRWFFNIHFLFAVLFAFAALTFSTDAWAHGNHQSRAGPNKLTAVTEKVLLSPAEHNQRTTVLASSTLAHLTEFGGKQSGVMCCCGSICFSCCSLLAQEIVISTPLTPIVRLLPIKTLPASGLGFERIRRPPKI